MDLNLGSDQVQLVETFAALYSRHATPELLRKAEPIGDCPELWTKLQQVGAVEMAVEAGGASLLDLALVAEQHGAFIAPAPLIEAQVAARLLAQLDSEGARQALPAATAGDRIVTLAVRPARSRSAELVPAGAIAHDAIVSTGSKLLLVPATADRRIIANLGSLPLADLTLGDDTVVLGESSKALQAFEHAVQEWMVLTANALVGLAARALEIGVEYVKGRDAFGSPIGSFQAISHPLAEHATNIDGARLLARKAAWAASEEPERFGELAVMAFAFAMETARDVTYHCLHFHGGNGFTLEYDIQLYFRRARALGSVLAGPRTMYRRVAATRYGAKGY